MKTIIENNINKKQKTKQEIQKTIDIDFLKLCSNISNNSPDANTKVGCVIVKNNKILTTSCNNIINGAKINNERVNRPLKYIWLEHAERNAIYNASRKGISLDKATIYINWWPCVDCCRAIIQSGINRIVSEKPPDLDDKRWGEQFKHTFDLFKEAEVRIDYVKIIYT